MKKIMVLILVSLHVVVVFAQKNKSNALVSKIFVIDKYGQDTLPRKLRQGSIIKFKILHVNNLVVGGYATVKSASINFDVPAALTTVLDGEGGSTKESNKSSENSLSSSENVASDKLNNMYQSSLKILNLIDTQSISKPSHEKVAYSPRGKTIVSKPIYDSIKKLNANIFALKNEFDALDKKYRNDLKKASGKIDQLRKQVTQYKTELENLKQQIADTNNKNFKDCYNKIMISYHNIGLYNSLEDRLYSQLNELSQDTVFIPDINAVTNGAEANYIVAYGSDTSNIAARQRVRSDLDNIYANFTELKNFYNNIQGIAQSDSIIVSGKLQTANGNTSFNISNAVLKPEKKKPFEDAFLFAQKIAGQLNEDSIRNKIITKSYAGIDLYHKIKADSFYYITDSKMINGDIDTIPVVLPYPSGKIAHSFNTILVESHGGIKVNFSTGYLLSFTGDDNYATYTNDTGRIIGVKKSDHSEITSSLGVLGHAYWRTACDFSAGVSAGFSVNNNANLGFYLGVSGFFLEKNRLVLTLGYSLIQKQVINMSNLKPDETYDPNNKNSGAFLFRNVNSNVPVYDKLYKGAFFLGLTFNILKS